MPELKWTTTAPPSSEQEYVVFASQLPAAGLRAVPSFLRHTLQITRQLSKSPGLLGYALRADVVRHRFWTLSVWKDEEALQAFVRTDPHARTMRELGRYTRNPLFTMWKTRSPLPLPSWTEVEERLYAGERATTRAA